MPIKNILLPEHDFVYTYYCGGIDDLQVRAYSDQLKKQLSEFKSYREIIDISRNVDFSNLSSETLTKTGALEKNRPNAGTGPLAILVTNPLTFGLARAYSTFAAEARTEVLISYSLDECIAFMGFNACQSLKIKNTIYQTNLGGNGLFPQNSLGFHFPSDN